MSDLYETAYRAGVPFPFFLEEANRNRELWHAVAERVRVDDEALARIRGVGGCWRLLVLADDWCGDAVNTLPMIAGLADAAANVEIRIVPRDQFPEVRDRHLTGGSRSIPMVILLDREGRPRGSWGPRPTPLQERFERELRALPADERYRELRIWYARDRGRTTAGEMAELFEASAAELPADLAGPCPGKAA